MFTRSASILVLVLVLVLRATVLVLSWSRELRSWSWSWSRELRSWSCLGLATAGLDYIPGKDASSFAFLEKNKSLSAPTPMHSFCHRDHASSSITLIRETVKNKHGVSTTRRTARIASAVLAMAFPSVCLSLRLSVRHTPVLSRNDGK